MTAVIVSYFLDFSFLRRPIWGWGNATVSAFPLVLAVGGGTAFPNKIFGGTAFSRVPPPLHH